MFLRKLPNISVVNCSRGSAKKVGARIKELERLYGIKNGSSSFQGNQYEVVVTNNSEAPKSQEDIAKLMGISVDTLQNYKKLTEMIPELEDLVDTGIRRLGFFLNIFITFNVILNQDHGSKFSDKFVERSEE